MLLSIQDIVCRYNQVEVIRALSLHVEDRSVVSIIGRNGGGKTTLLRTISGLLKPINGKIEFQGERIDRLPAYKVARLGIAHVPEGRGIFPKLTVKENLEMGAYLRRDKDIIKRDVDRVFVAFPRLKERRMQLGYSLSGGEAQMLAIARGLMAGPRLVLIDEPSMGLAPLLVGETFRVIRKINEDSGVSIVLVSEAVFDALEISDKGYVMELGKIVLDGTGSELFESEEVKRIYMGQETSGACS